MTDQTPTRAEVERHHHWSVTVETSGDHIITLEPECYGGREPSAADEEAIRTAAYHLLSFIGDDTPEALRERAEAAEAERDEARAAYLAHKRLRIDAEQQAHAARRAEAAAWNDAARICDELAIGYARQRSAVCALTEAARDIRALRRAAPTEGEV